MPYNGTNPVVLNEAPKKSEYDRVFDNTVDLHTRLIVNHNVTSGIHDLLDLKPTLVSGANKTAATEVFIEMSVGAANRVLTLPLVSSVPLGRTYFIRKEGAANILLTITCSGADTIDGLGASIRLYVPGQTVILMASGGGLWRMIADRIPFMGLRRHNTAVQTYTTGVNAVQIFPTSTYDDLVGLTYAAGIFTCVTPGIWDFHSHIEWVSNATGYRRAYMTHSVGGIIDLNVNGAVNGEDSSNDVRAVYKMLTGETVSIVALQNSGGNLNVKAGSFFQAHLIRPSFV